MITRPRRAATGKPRCIPTKPGAGTEIVPEYQEFLDSLGVTYRQWNYWQAMDWMPQKPWHKIINDDALRQRAFDLSESARLKAMTIPELADHLAEERKAYESI